MRTRIRRIQRRKIVSIVLVVAVLLFAVRVLLVRAGSPLQLAGPNLVANNNFAIDSDNNGIPDGWTTAFPDAKGIQRRKFTVTPGSGYSMYIAGVNNWLRSPLIDVRPGESYLVSLQALADNTEPNKQSPTQVELWFHWLDARGIDFNIDLSDRQTVPYRQWAAITATRQAPPRAAQLSISIHPLTDDRIVVDQFRLSQVGVHIGAWPNGKAAALAFSFDYETEMGGLIHTRSEDDPNATTDPQQRAQRMRAGADLILALFQREGVRGTFYTTGYNFLTGNRDGRVFMNNPTYTWATTDNRWATNYWQSHPWFSSDPHTDEQANPEWYFGSQVRRLYAAGQDIQSHTFAHFAGSYVGPDDWRADFAAWKAVAAEQEIAPATSLAFPWSSSAGMTAQSWQVLADNGIRSVTRTNWSQPRFALADRTTYALRPLPINKEITVIADEYVQPPQLPQLEARVAAAVANGGAIDLWAHTEETVSAAQQATWQALVHVAKQRCWIAPVPEIVAYHTTVRDLRVVVRSEQPQYVFQITNPDNTDLHGLTLTLPMQPKTVQIGGVRQAFTSNQLQLDLPAHHTVEVTLWPA
ncbi:MAG: polysaccharide deacetylase [Herpetosiphonaceae bacterium]|nr:polysaccharide deacetylase [Herpetosiphonaceae bacterium]